MTTFYAISNDLRTLALLGGAPSKVMLNYLKEIVYYLLFVVTALPHPKTFQYIFPDIRVYSAIILVNMMVCVILAYKLYKKFNKKLSKATYVILFIQIYSVIYYVLNGAFYVYILNSLQGILISIIIGYAVWFEGSFDKLCNSILIVNFFALIYSVIDFSVGSQMFFYLGGDVGIYYSGYRYRFTGIFGPPGIATVFFCTLFLYYLYKGVVENFNSPIWFGCAAISTIFGLSSFSRAFIIGSLIFGLMILLANYKHILRSSSKIIVLCVIVGMVSVLFGAYIDEMIEIYKMRFEMGFDNRKYGINGVFDLIDNIDLETLFLGNLYFFDKESFVVINNRYFQVDNGFLYYLTAFGIWVAVPVAMLYLFTIRTFATGFVRTLKFNSEKCERNLLYLFIILCMLLNSISEATLLAPINVAIISLALRGNLRARTSNRLFKKTYFCDTVKI